MLEGITLDRRSTVPLRRQLAAHLEARILAGRIPPGRRLPSVRRVAGRLSLHRNTVAAAYRDMAGRGLVDRLPGSGVYVTDAAVGDPAARCSPPDWQEAVRGRRLVVMTSDPDLGPALASEIRTRLPGVRVHIRPNLPSGAGVPPAGWLPGVPVLPGALGDVADCTSGIAIRLSVAPWFRRAVRHLRRPAVVAMGSSSEAVHRLVSGAVVLEAGEGVGYAPYDPRRPSTAATAVRLAELIVADALTVRSARRLLATRVATLELVAPTTIEGLRHLFDRRSGTCSERSSYP